PRVNDAPRASESAVAMSDRRQRSQIGPERLHLRFGEVLRRIDRHERVQLGSVLADSSSHELLEIRIGPTLEPGLVRRQVRGLRDFGWCPGDASAAQLLAVAPL